MFAWSRFLLKYPRHDEVRRKRSSLKRNHFSSCGLSGSSQTYRWRIRCARRALPMKPGFSHGFESSFSWTSVLKSLEEDTSGVTLVCICGSSLDVMTELVKYLTGTMWTNLLIRIKIGEIYVSHSYSHQLLWGCNLLHHPADISIIGSSFKYSSSCRQIHPLPLHSAPKFSRKARSSYFFSR
jgi:hypothetical protein